GNVTAGKTLTVCLRNDGEAALQIGEITLAGVDPGDFKLSPDCANSALQPGQECRLNLTFTPQVRAGRANKDRFSSASLVVRHNAGSGQDETRLSGAGVDAQPQSKRGWCCVSGKIEDLDARECRRREGASYPDEASARRGCRPIR